MGNYHLQGFMYMNKVVNELELQLVILPINVYCNLNFA